MIMIIKVDRNQQDCTALQCNADTLNIFNVRYGKLMNGFELKFAYIIPENKKKFINEDIAICCECGSLETTIRTGGIYCRICGSFKHF